MTNFDLPDALDCLAKRGKLLHNQYCHDWGRRADEATGALRFRRERRPLKVDPNEGRPGTQPPWLVAIVGGASSGKSTVFNNLLGGRPASRVTARGHATRGPIAAVHELRREAVEQAIHDGLLMPSLSPRVTGLDDNVVGEPDALHVVYHEVDTLKDVVLLDTPDLTSEPARLEGDIALAMLPWFDRLIVMVDSERWFDRQTIGRLRDESSQFGQERLVVFNRGREGQLSPEELARLRQQADRLGAAGQLVLEFRRGRGFLTFPPGTFDSIVSGLGRPVPSRDRALLRFLGRLAAVILNNNTRRRERLDRLRQALERAPAAAVPSRAECFIALMTPDERQYLDVITRMLRIVETRQWLARQADRIKQELRRRVPVVGPLLVSKGSDEHEPAADSPDRQTVGWEVFRSRCTRQLGAIDEAATGSDFWADVRRWAAVEVPRSSPVTIADHRESVRAAVRQFGKAVDAWTAKVASECKGASPRLIGAVGATSVAAAIVLVVVTGPVGVLTLPAIKAALGGALVTLATSAGAGAVGGPALARLLTIVHEKLLGGAEFKAVQDATDAYCEAIAAFGRAAVNESLAAAAALVLPEDDELTQALKAVCDAAEID